MKIESWFPKSILVCEDFEKDSLQTIASNVTLWVEKAGSIRQEIFEVNSTHLTDNRMHLDPMFNDLTVKILDKAKQFAVEFGYTDDTIDKLCVTNMWANISKEGDFLESHIHQNSFLSGVFYIQAPKGSKIIFYDHSDMSMVPEYPTQLSYTFTAYECIPGRLLMWKSNLQHGTPKQPPGEDKIIISFNINFRIS